MSPQVRERERESHQVNIQCKQSKVRPLKKKKKSCFTVTPQGERWTLLSANSRIVKPNFPETTIKPEKCPYNTFKSSLHTSGQSARYGFNKRGYASPVCRRSPLLDAREPLSPAGLCRLAPASGSTGPSSFGGQMGHGRGQPEPSTVHGALEKERKRHR